MPYKDRVRQNAFNLRRVTANRKEWFTGKSCWSCGTTSNLEVEWNGTGERNHRVWSLRRERREAILVNYRVTCRKHRETGREHWYKPEQIQKIVDAFWAGLGRKSTAALLGSDQRTVERHLAKLGLGEKIPRRCGCGKPFHRGMCWWRLTLEQLRTLDSESQENLRQWRKAQAVLNQLKMRLMTINRSAPKSRVEA